MGWQYQTWSQNHDKDTLQKNGNLADAIVSNLLNGLPFITYSPHPNAQRLVHRHYIKWYWHFSLQQTYLIFSKFAYIPEHVQLLLSHYSHSREVPLLNS